MRNLCYSISRVGNVLARAGKPRFLGFSGF